VAQAFETARPRLVLHTAALARVNACHADPVRAWEINTRASEILAELADRAKARLVMVSTDLVFDGEKGGYLESDAAKPLSVYGRTKLAGEQAVRSIPGSAVARVSLLLGAPPSGR